MNRTVMSESSTEILDQDGVPRPVVEREDNRLAIGVELDPGDSWLAEIGQALGLPTVEG